MMDPGLCYHASWHIINIKPMIHMYCVRKGGEIFKMTTWIINFMDKHLNFVYYTIICNLSKNINTLNFQNTWIRYYHISKFMVKVK